MLEDSTESEDEFSVMAELREPKDNVGEVVANILDNAVSDTVQDIAEEKVKNTMLGALSDIKNNENSRLRNPKNFGTTENDSQYEVLEDSTKSEDEFSVMAGLREPKDNVNEVVENILDGAMSDTLGDIANEKVKNTILDALSDIKTDENSRVKNPKNFGITETDSECEMLEDSTESEDEFSVMAELREPKDNVGEVVANILDNAVSDTVQDIAEEKVKNTMLGALSDIKNSKNSELKNPSNFFLTQNESQYEVLEDSTESENEFSVMAGLREPNDNVGEVVQGILNNAMSDTARDVAEEKVKNALLEALSEVKDSEMKVPSQHDVAEDQEERDLSEEESSAHFDVMAGLREMLGSQFSLMGKAADDEDFLDTTTSGESCPDEVGISLEEKRRRLVRRTRMIRRLVKKGRPPAELYVDPNPPLRRNVRKVRRTKMVKR